MSGVNGISLPTGAQILFDKVIMPFPMFNFEGCFKNDIANWRTGIPLITFLLLIIFSIPNTQQLMSRYRPALNMTNNERKEWWYNLIVWKPNLSWALVFAFMFCFAVTSLIKVSEFLYFNF